MFYVYGLSGPIFQGTLENLSHFPPVTERGPVEAVRRVGGREESAINQQIDQQTGVNTVIGTGTNAAIHEQAIAEYRAMLPQELERGPLYHARQLMQPEVVTVAADDSA
ncbi:MAG: hypothetical protein ABI478_15305, partial [Propionivibrio sp.]